MPVSAEVHSDDHVFEVEFDAEPYLAQASEQEITDLIECGWGGDYPADAVAEHFKGSNLEIDRLFDHLDNIKDLHSHRDMCGFECHVDEDEGAAWVRANRPQLAYLLGDGADEKARSAVARVTR